ncbi:TPR repeat [hydrothermal vent metagenome]|uniref:TPR repeat n=1 Tax=hydrothermal vent metagenome TaxID=652676 RepID=A0A1W1EL54_9ZZZZ
MNTFQFFLLLLSFTIFYRFFKQLFSQNYPKRGVDFEASREDKQIGHFTNMNKSFQEPPQRVSRLEELNHMADESIEKGDFDEAKKALDSALIVKNDDIETASKLGFVLMKLKYFKDAKEIFEKILLSKPDDDMIYSNLATIYRELSQNDKSIEHHQIAIALDNDYAPHYFNYANTLYSLGKRDEALNMYKKAYELDSDIKEAKNMIEKLK